MPAANYERTNANFYDLYGKDLVPKKLTDFPTLSKAVYVRCLRCQNDVWTKKSWQALLSNKLSYIPVCKKDEGGCGSTLWPYAFGMNGPDKRVPAVEFCIGNMSSRKKNGQILDVCTISQLFNQFGEDIPIPSRPRPPPVQSPYESSFQLVVPQAQGQVATPLLNQSSSVGLESQTRSSHAPPDAAQSSSRRAARKVQSPPSYQSTYQEPEPSVQPSRAAPYSTQSSSQQNKRRAQPSDALQSPFRSPYQGSELPAQPSRAGPFAVQSSSNRNKRRVQPSDASHDSEFESRTQLSGEAIKQSVYAAAGYQAQSLRPALSPYQNPYSQRESSVHTSLQPQPPYQTSYSRTKSSGQPSAMQASDRTRPSIDNLLNPTPVTAPPRRPSTRPSVPGSSNMQPFGSNQVAPGSNNTYGAPVLVPERKFESTQSALTTTEALASIMLGPSERLSLNTSTSTLSKGARGSGNIQGNQQASSMGKPQMLSSASPSASPSSPSGHSKGLIAASTQKAKQTASIKTTSSSSQGRALAAKPQPAIRPVPKPTNQAGTKLQASSTRRSSSSEPEPSTSSSSKDLLGNKGLKK